MQRARQRDGCARAKFLLRKGECSVVFSPGKPFSTMSNAAEIDGPYAWFRLIVTLVLGTIGSVGMWVAVVVLPEAQTEFGVDRAGASIPSRCVASWILEPVR